MRNGSFFTPALIAILGIVDSAGSHAADADAQKIVAELDTQYQEAVKKNDAATMDRILADDFVLVTGRGKTYTKVDLLKAARAGKVVYEHQEETSQTFVCGATRWS